MRSFCQLALLALPLLGSVVAKEPASPSPTKPTDNVVQAIYANANEAFQDLLNALPEESLHAALNSLSHFRDGIFESSKRGVEHIHQGDPPLATKLIVAAVQDLKKRQQAAPSNGTTPSTPAPESSSLPESTPAPENSPAPETSQDTPQSTQGAPESTPDAPRSTQAPAPESSAVLVPVPVPTTDAQGRSTVVSSAILSRPTASVAVPVTRTNAQGQTEVATETKPAVIVSTTDAAGSAIVTTSAVDFAPTKGQVLTSTDERGTTFLTTYTPGSGRVSSVLLITTTDADGQQAVVTSFTYVDPAAATATGEEEPGSTGKPSLQGRAAVQYGAVDAVLLGGAFAGALAILV